MVILSHEQNCRETEKIAELCQKFTINFQQRMGTVEMSKRIMVKLEMAL